MSELRIALLAAILGVGIGVALGYYEVGEVETRLTPPIEESNAEILTAEDIKAFPKASFDSLEYDFGTMQRGSTESHEFIVTNEGEKPLSIEVANTSCKCTVGDVDNDSIAPGESTPIRLEWVAKTGIGEFSQVAIIRTNDPRNSRIELKVTGIVTDKTGLSPQEFILGRMTTDQRRSASVFLVGYDETPIEIEAKLAKDANKPELYDIQVEQVEDLSKIPLPAATSGVKLTVTAGPKLPLGQLTEWIEVTTNLDDTEVVRIPIVATVEGNVSIRGREWAKNLGAVIFGRIKKEVGDEANLFISVKGEQAADATASVGTVWPEWLEVSTGDPKKIRDEVTHIPLKIKVPVGQVPAIYNGKSAENGGQGNGEARVQILTNLPNTPEIDVRVRFIIE